MAFAQEVGQGVAGVAQRWRAVFGGYDYGLTFRGFLAKGLLDGYVEAAAQLAEPVIHFGFYHK